MCKRETDLYQLDTFRIHESVRPSDTSGPESSWAACVQSCQTFLPAWCRSNRAVLRCTGLHAAEDWRSALEIVVQYEVTAFARDPWFNRLVWLKWTKFARRLYILRVVAVYAVLLILFGALVTLRCGELKLSNVAVINSAGSGPIVANKTACHADASCGWKFDQQIRQAFSPECGSSAAAASLVLQGLIAGPFAVWLVLTGWRQRKITLRDLDVNDDRRIAASEVQDFIFKNLIFIVNIISGLVLFFAGVSRVQCWEQEEVRLLAVSSILLFCNALNVLVPFRYVGAMVITVYRMIMGDVFRFLLVYGLLWCGFAFAMVLLCQRVDLDGLGLDGHEPDVPSNAFLNLGFVALGDNVGGFIFGLYPSTQDPRLVLGLYSLWVIMSSVLVLYTYNVHITCITSLDY
jgi:hypothetical protein